MNIFLTTEFWIWQFSDTYLTHFWQFSRQIFAADIFLTVAQRMFLRNVSWSWLHKFTYFWHISDSFTDPTLTVFWHNYEFRHISETFPILIWQISDRILNLTVFWHISGSFLTHFRQFSDTFPKCVGPTFNKSTGLPAYSDTGYSDSFGNSQTIH